MLTYAFDLLHAIYEEEGYDAAEIPALILTHNLQGIEIDDRAGALAAFALAMKAAARLGRRRFLRTGGASPTSACCRTCSFTAAEMQDVAAVVGRDLFTGELRETLGQFEQAKNFGSLIVPKLRDPAEVARVVSAEELRRRSAAARGAGAGAGRAAHGRGAVAQIPCGGGQPAVYGSKGLNERSIKMLLKRIIRIASPICSPFIERCLELSKSHRVMWV